MDDQPSSRQKGSPSEPGSTVTGHVTPERIADAHAGLATAQETQSVAAHLESCSTCAAVAADIDAVPQRLAAAPPDVIPESVSSALQATIAAEAARRASRTRAVGRPTDSSADDGVAGSARDASPRKQDLWSGSRPTVGQERE